MEEQVLKVEKADGIATLTLNRPQAMNALSRALRRALIQTFGELATDPETRVVILTGAGRAFCAGLDLKELGGEAGDTAANETEAAISGGELVKTMARLEQPIIGAINGFAITGGFELALACDVLIASTEARFADTHARVGIMPGWGLSQKLSRTIGIYRAKELSLTGNFLDAERAERWGLVNRVVEPEALMPTALGLASDMLSTIPDMLVRMKRVIDEGYAMPFGDALAHESRVAGEYRASVRPEDIERRRRAIIERGKSQRG